MVSMCLQFEMENLDVDHLVQPQLYGKIPYNWTTGADCLTAS